MLCCTFFNRIWQCNLLYVMVPYSYEKRYVEDMKLKSAEHEKVDKAEEPMKDGITSEEQVKDANHQSKTATSSSAEQDLDAFLLGDPGDSDDGPGNHWSLFTYLKMGMLRRTVDASLVLTSIPSEMNNFILYYLFIYFIIFFPLP